MPPSAPDHLCSRHQNRGGASQEYLQCPSITAIGKARSRFRAFSLVEVVLAIGISSLSLLVVFSLIPTGLGVLHDASQQIVGAEIITKIGTELTSTPFYSDPSKSTDILANYRDSRFPIYFDVEGNELTGGTAAAEAVFTADCVLTQPSAGAGELRHAKVSLSVNKKQGFSQTFLLVNRGN